MTSNETNILKIIQDIINYYQRGLEFHEENPTLFALHMATQIEEIRIKVREEQQKDLNWDYKAHENPYD